MVESKAEEGIEGPGGLQEAKVRGLEVGCFEAEVVRLSRC